VLDVSVAAAAAAATMTTVMSTAVAATAIAHVASAATITTAPTVAAVATVTGDGLAVTADKGDANHREENRDAKNQCSIHPRILQTSNLA
jgi:hypothetical protein